MSGPLDLTPAQMESVAAFIGNFGFVVIMLGFCAHFIYQGFRKDPKKKRSTGRDPKRKKSADR